MKKIKASIILACMFIQCTRAHKNNALIVSKAELVTPFSIQVESQTSMYDFSEEYEYLELIPKPITGKLKIPRLAIDEEKQQRLSLQIQRDAEIALSCAYAYRCTNDNRFKMKSLEYITAWSHIEQLEDGGQFFFDFFIGRMAGDTPIVITCQYSKFILAAFMIQEKPESFLEQIKRTYHYIRHYHPAENNNHRTWKYLYLLFASLYIEDNNQYEYLLEINKCIQTQINHQGIMIREQKRGKKAISYTLMNLEAMVFANYIAKKLHFQLSEDQLIAALDNYYMFLTNEDAWRRNFKIDNELNEPNPRQEWAWIFVLPRQWWNKSYIFKDEPVWGKDCSRAYILKYTQFLR